MIHVLKYTDTDCRADKNTILIQAKKKKIRETTEKILVYQLFHFLHNKHILKV